MNFVAACEGVPAFLLIVWVQREDVPGAATACDAKGDHHNCAQVLDSNLRFVAFRVLVLGFLLILVCFLGRTGTWVRRRFPGRKAHEEQDDTGGGKEPKYTDFTSFLHEVLDPRGRDPREEEDDGDSPFAMVEDL